MTGYRHKVRLTLTQAEANAIATAAGVLLAGGPGELEAAYGTHWRRQMAACERAWIKLGRALGAAEQRDRAGGA